MANDKAFWARNEQRVAIAIRVVKGYGYRHRRDACVCDICQKSEGVHPHEIYQRSLTSTWSDERQMCYHRAVISLLCPICHDLAQGDEEWSSYLLDRNRYLFGSELVDNQIEQIERMLNERRGIY